MIVNGQELEFFQEEKQELLNPVDGGVVTSSFGKRMNPITKKEEFHDGLDIAVPSNTKAVAVKDGIITEVRQSPTWGVLVKYQTSDNEIIQYSHLNQVLLKVGEKVKQGEVIALTGNTGISTGPHLHYGIWENGELRDPMELTKLPYTKEVESEYAWRGAKLP